MPYGIKTKHRGHRPDNRLLSRRFLLRRKKVWSFSIKTAPNVWGVNALGTEQGPPLLHDIYNPGHHSDMAFYRAVQSGVPQHHWRFGNMLPQRHVSRKQTELIIAYIRELQRANGIKYKKHQM